MSLRKALIIHPEERVRASLKAQVSDVFEVTEVASRREALDALASAPPALVIAHHEGFRRLLRDLERHAPGATRAVVCGRDQEPVRRELVEIASEGYHFFTVDGSPSS